jgi:putative Mn2+ efflux pump MntP
MSPIAISLLTFALMLIGILIGSFVQNYCRRRLTPVVALILNPPPHR